MTSNLKDKLVIEINMNDLNEAEQYAIENNLVLFNWKQEKRYLKCQFVKKKQKKESAKKEYYIWAPTNGWSEMYLAEQGTTFDINYAKLFSLEESTKKVRMMNRRGRYTWKYRKL